MDIKELKDLLVADCREFGLGRNRVYQIFSIVVLEKLSSGDNQLSFYYDDKEGYVMVYWERGYKVNGIKGQTPDDFRLEFQLFNRNEYDFPIDNTKSRNERMKQEKEFLMSMLAPKFGHTNAYKKWLEHYKKIGTTSAFSTIIKDNAFLFCILHHILLSNGLGCSEQVEYVAYIFPDCYAMIQKDARNFRASFYLFEFCHNSFKTVFW